METNHIDSLPLKPDRRRIIAKAKGHGELRLQIENDEDTYETRLSFGNRRNQKTKHSIGSDRKNSFKNVGVGSSARRWSFPHFRYGGENELEDGSKTLQSRSLPLSKVGDSVEERRGKDGRDTIALIDTFLLKCYSGESAINDEMASDQPHRTKGETRKPSRGKKKTSRRNPSNDVMRTSSVNSELPAGLMSLGEMARLRVSRDGMVPLGASSNRRMVIDSFLKRLDLLLSELVEKEKSNINSICNGPKKKANTNDLKRASDLMESHKKCFTDLKTFKPRILKTAVESKLSKCNSYQRPKQKRKTKLIKDKDPETNSRPSSCYSEDFDSSDSPRSPEVSSSEDDTAAIPTKVPLIAPEFENGNNNTGLMLLPPPVTLPCDRKKQYEDEDTCYGSDNLGSDMGHENSDSFKHPKSFPAVNGDHSVDSAYTGSREATPDDLGGERLEEWVQISDNLRPWKTPQSTSLVYSKDSGAQRLRDAKRFLLERIKESGLYSDGSINSLLHYYSKKWHHLSHYEIKQISGAIRRDLGVSAPVRTCIGYLFESENEAELGRDVSSHECLNTISCVLPRYLESFRHEDANKRCRNTEKKIPENIFAGKNEADRRSFNSDIFATSEPTEAWIVGSRVKDRRSDEAWIGGSRVTDRSSDEVWIRDTLGNRVVKDLKKTLSKNEVQNFEVISPSEVDKLASDLCEQFGLVL